MTAFSYTNPTVGGSEDTWGTTLNANWTALGNFIGPLDSTELAVLDGITATTAELNYVDGVTSPIQTQLNAKSTASATETLTNKTITAPTITAPTISAPVINGAVSGDSLSTQVEAEAGTNNDQLMTPLRTAQAIAALASSSTTFGTVGTYVWAAPYDYGNTDYLPNATIAGSLLYVAGVAIMDFNTTDLPSGTNVDRSTEGAWTSTTALSGTWQAMGYNPSNASSISSGRWKGMTLWLRIS